MRSIDMSKTTTDWTAWLGPAADEMTDDQRARFEREADEILAGIPEGDLFDEREAALSAVVQYVLGDMTIDDAGRQRVSTQRAARLALVAAQQHARLAVLDGMPETEAARRAGIDRMTVRKALGK